MALIRALSGENGDYYNSLSIKTFYGTQNTFSVTIDPDDKVFAVANNSASGSSNNGLQYTELFEGDEITLSYSLSGSTYRTKFERSGTTAKATKVGSSSAGGHIAVLTHVNL